MNSTIRYSLLATTAVAFSLPLAAEQGATGLLTFSSARGVAETTERIESTARARGLTVFATIDHAGEAQKAGLSMRATRVILLGNPKAGTPVMAASPSVAIDLPLKVLVADNGVGGSVVTINDPAWIRKRHDVPEDLVKNIAGLGPLVETALK